MKKTLIAMLAGAMLFGTAAQAEILSPWAVTEFDGANSAGLLPQSIVSDTLTDNITRAEFCDIVMNLYKVLGGEIPEKVASPFTDTDKESIKLAYTLGVIDGKTPKLFYPNDHITRQEMAKIVMRTVNAADKDAHITVEELEELLRFEDFSDTADWAAADMAKSVKYEVLNGVSSTHLAPRGNATREQAVAIINRAFDAFCEDKVLYKRPKINDLYDDMILSEGFSFSWDKLSGAEEYVVIVKDIVGNTVVAKRVTGNYADLQSKNLTYNRYYTVIVGARLSDDITVYSDAVEVFYGTEQKVNVITSTQGRYNRVFPDGTPFKIQADADRNMQEITVPIWQMNSSGKKRTATATLVVNRALAEEVLQIFTEIYRSPEQFPIKDVGAYSWRTTAFGSVSQHSYGTCIDINFNENYYSYPTGEAITGSHWRPYDDPFSITPTGSVMRAFKKYGWTWGGDWTSLKDYMHFSYLGK